MQEFEGRLDKELIEQGDFQLLKTVMDLVPNPMSIKNKRLERIAVNQAFVDISGYSKQMLLGESKLDIQSADTKTLVDFDKQVLSTKQSNKHIEKIINREGETRWVEIQKSYFQNEMSEDHVISILTDITSLKKREFELVKSKKHTHERSLQRSRFLANIGHDIREPLRGIIGTTSLLRDSNLDASQTQAVDLLGRAGDTLMRVLDDVIDFAKIDAGVMEVKPHPFKLRDFIEDMTDVLGLSARDKQIDLIASIDSRLPDIFLGDTVRIRQILMNLIENSLKFTTEGFVSINVNGQLDKNIAKLEFTVKDTGSGIPPEKLQGLFQAVDNDESTDRMSGVSGLGVSLCQRLAKLMGGELEADSVDGIGSEFKLILPLKFKPKAESNQSVLNLLEMGPAAAHKVLFVDDIKENYDAMLPYLSEHGLTADYAQSAANAVQLLNNALLSGSPYTLIFIDYLMPMTPGLLLTTSLRSSKHYSNVTIVALSSVNDSELRDCFASHNVEHYLTKPVRKTDLDNVITSVSNMKFRQAS